LIESSISSVGVDESLSATRLRILEDVALIGFDEFELAGIATPSLTTVAQSLVEVDHGTSAPSFSRDFDKLRPIELQDSQLLPLDVCSTVS
jgi:hypothetical protein